MDPFVRSVVIGKVQKEMNGDRNETRGSLLSQKKQKRIDIREWRCTDAGCFNHKIALGVESQSTIVELLCMRVVAVLFHIAAPSSKSREHVMFWRV
jgi:hypothetical protein